MSVRSWPRGSESEAGIVRDALPLAAVNACASRSASNGLGKRTVSTLVFDKLNASESPWLVINTNPVANGDPLARILCASCTPVISDRCIALIAMAEPTRAATSTSPAPDRATQSRPRQAPEGAFGRSWPERVTARQAAPSEPRHEQNRSITVAWPAVASAKSGLSQLQTNVGARFWTVC